MWHWAESSAISVDDNAASQPLRASQWLCGANQPKNHKGELIIYKIAFVVAFAWAVGVALNVARRASRRHGGSLNQLANEVRGLIALRAILGVVFYAMLFVWLFRNMQPSWAHVSVAAPIRIGATILLVPALAFFTWSFQSIGTNYRGGVGLYDDHELVTTGAYRVMRHPIYVAFIIIMLLMLPLSENWLLALSGLLLVSSIAFARIPVEERELRERFGERWQQYCARTARFVPWS